MAESRFTSVRNAFLTGILLVAPLAVTVWALQLVIELVGGSITPLFVHYLPQTLQKLPPIFWKIITTFIALTLVTLLGYVSRLFLGRLVGAAAERFIQNIPGVGAFYHSVKQFIE